MLSILIPTYNHDPCPLIRALLTQLDREKVACEIICLDDASPLPAPGCMENSSYPGVIFEKLTHNTGRSKIRNLLASKAKYPWLLFMDADTLPVRKEFITTYLNVIRKPEADVYFGGIAYRPGDNSPQTSLRYHYGINRESHKVEKRNKSPYKTLLMSNTLMKKEVFDRHKFDGQISRYGHEDAVFSYGLYEKQYRVRHIDNPAYHTGLEENGVFLKKTLVAVENLWQLYRKNLIRPEINKLLRYYLLLRKTGGDRLLNTLFKIYHPAMEKRLTGSKPPLWLFDFYRLSYLCSVANNNHTEKTPAL